LVGSLVEHRLTVPEPSAKTALRQIARDTGSSYSRVRQCEQRLNSSVRRALLGDLEYRRLIEMAKAAAEGTNEPIDSVADAELRRLGAEAFWRKFMALDERAQVTVWRRLTQDGDESLAPAVKRWFAELSRETADRLASQVSDAR
jgi:hypothetical protein